MNRLDMAEWFQDLISLDEAAKLLKKDPSTIRHAIKDGRLQEGHHCMKYGKQWVLHKSAIYELDSWSPWSGYVTDQIIKKKAEERAAARDFTTP